jgi:hypothetical protein
MQESVPEKRAYSLRKILLFGPTNKHRPKFTDQVI